jgi:hypothetical protein
MPSSATESYQRSPVTRDRIRPRTIFSIILFVLATVLTPLAVTSHWAHTTILDAERYIETVGPIGTDPEVQMAFGEVVTNAILEQVDTEALVGDFLGGLIPNAPLVSDRLAGPIATGINSLIGEAVTRFVTSDAFTDAWIALNTAAQRGLVAVLEGEPSGPIQIDGDNLVLSLDSLIVLGQEKLVEQGITFAENITIPATDRQFVLMNVPALEQARTFYSFSAPILNWIMVLVAFIFIGSILLARRRARTTVTVGIVVMANSLLIFAIVTAGEGVFTNQFIGSIFESASIIVYQNFLNYLVAGIQALFFLGVIIVIGGWLSGRTQSAGYIRGHFTTGLNELAARTGWRTGDKIAPYAPLIRWAVVAIWLIFLLSGTYLGSFSGTMITLLMLGIWTGLEILIRASSQPTRQEVLVERVEVIEVLDQA